MTTRTPERREFLADVLTTAIEGGIGYWAGVDTYAWRSPGLGEHNAELLIQDEHADAQARVYELEEDEPETHVVDLDLIAKGIGLLVDDLDSYHPYFREFAKANRTNGEDGDYDAAVADVIVQLGLFGEVVYG